MLEHKNLKNKKLEENKYEWFYFSLSYFHATNTLLETAIKVSGIEAKMHIIPALYNLRHAIELSIKFLHNFVSDNKYAKTHDISELFDNVSLRLRTYSNLQIEKFVKQEESIKITVPEVRNIINDNVNSLSAIITKYYFQTPLQRSLSSERFFIKDHDNELFRYPEAKNITFYYQSISMINIKKSELELIKLDVQKMKSIIYFFFTLFTTDSKKGLHNK